MRNTIWRYLFEHYRPDMTTAQREEHDIACNANYKSLKEKWELLCTTEAATVPAEGLDLDSLFASKVDAINMDVLRCDDSHPFYAGNPDKVTDLAEIMKTFVYQYHRHEYVQGMTGNLKFDEIDRIHTLIFLCIIYLFIYLFIFFADILEPIYAIVQDKAVAFSCLCGAMKYIELRFDRMSEKGIQECLANLRALLQYLDLPLYQAIKEKVCFVCVCVFFSDFLSV